MTAESQILREIRLLREDLAKFKQSVYKQEKEKEQWVTADVLQKRFGTNFRELEQLRKQEAIRFRQIKKGVVRYLLSSAEQYFLNKKQAS